MNRNGIGLGLDRRTWLKRAGAAAAGLALGSRSAFGQAAPGGHAARYPELKYINLAGNENPFGPSPAVSLAVMREVSNSCRYPFREEKILKESIAAWEGVDPDWIVLGNGCDEILSLTGAAYGRPGASIVATRPTYLQLMSYAERRGATVRWIDHDASMRHDLSAMAAAIDESTSLVYICNPDTPTGTVVSSNSLESFCRSASDRTAIFIDEVYLDLMEDFRERTMARLVKEGLPIIIGRSFSKMHGLAGHRVGYAIAAPETAARLEANKMSSLNYLGVIAAIASVRDRSFHEQSVRMIKAGRDRLCALLDRLGLPYTPSVGNFVFHRTGRPVREFQATMKSRNFLVGRPFPPYDDWCRISIGNVREMELYEAAMLEVFR